MKYYVYEHSTKSGEVFYIGKGCGARSHATDGRSKEWHKMVANHGLNIRIVQSGMSENDALSLEVHLIALLGRKNKGEGKLVNKTAGGEAGYQKTKERSLVEGNARFYDDHYDVEDDAFAMWHEDKPDQTSDLTEIFSSLQGVWL